MSSNRLNFGTVTGKSALESIRGKFGRPDAPAARANSETLTPGGSSTASRETPPCSSQPTIRRDEIAASISISIPTATDRVTLGRR